MVSLATRSSQKPLEHRWKNTWPCLSWSLQTTPIMPKDSLLPRWCFRQSVRAYICEAPVRQSLNQIYHLDPIKWRLCLISNTEKNGWKLHFVYGMKNRLSYICDHSPKPSGLVSQFIAPGPAPSLWNATQLVAIRVASLKNKTYNSRDSLVVTHPTTNRPACGLHAVDSRVTAPKRCEVVWILALARLASVLYRGVWYSTATHTRV